MQRREATWPARSTLTLSFAAIAAQPVSTALGAAPVSGPSASLSACGASGTAASAAAAAAAAAPAPAGPLPARRCSALAPAASALWSLLPLPCAFPAVLEAAALAPAAAAAGFALAAAATLFPPAAVPLPLPNKHPCSIGRLLPGVLRAKRASPCAGAASLSELPCCGTSAVAAPLVGGASLPPEAADMRRMLPKREDAEKKLPLAALVPAGRKARRMHAEWDGFEGAGRQPMHSEHKLCVYVGGGIGWQAAKHIAVLRHVKALLIRC